jgi:UDP-N-acetylmuramate-alanine ligase
MYNVLNSLAVIVVMSLLAAEKERDGDEQARVMKTAAVAASNALAEFAGLRRRFDWIGTVQGCHIIDDYAHHPTEVRAVLQAARQRFDQQPIWVIFQPHTVSRLATFLLDFAPAFSAADRVIVTKVYTARNIQTVKMVTGEELANAIIGPPAVYIPELDDVVERLSWELAALQKNAMNDRGNVVLLTLGAGDITSVGPRLIQALSVPTA